MAIKSESPKSDQLVGYAEEVLCEAKRMAFDRGYSLEAVLMAFVAGGLNMVADVTQENGFCIDDVKCTLYEDLTNAVNGIVKKGA